MYEIKDNHNTYLSIKLNHCSHMQYCGDSDVDGCGHLPCENGAQCEEFVNDFVCICLPGYSGHLCELGK